ncbi:hypothetical protein LZ30DRAFT_709226 [Colletotrichum cereale]|nr:hypothetical protein LZ30DRAFT_709226 [Colletotrichum cereale]
MNGLFEGVWAGGLFPSAPVVLGCLFLGLLLGTKKTRRLVPFLVQLASKSLNPLEGPAAIGAPSRGLRHRRSEVSRSRCCE